MPHAAAAEVDLAPAPRLPLYIEARQLAQALDWTPWRAINLMRRAGIYQRRGRCGVCTRDDLRRAFPEVYEELADKLEALKERPTSA